MAGFFPMKTMKRKELDEVNTDFSDFSLSSPARKIRRLDAELPPIIEEEPEDPARFEPSMMAEEYVPQAGGPVIEELPEENEERAIVLYNSSANTPLLLQSPSNYYSVDPKFLSGLKNRFLLSSQSSGLKSAEGEAERPDSDAASNGCLAVVPWVPSLLSPTAEPKADDVGELMDAEDTEATAMDFEEEEAVTNIHGQGFGYGGGLQQQQQQHCMFPEFPQRTSTPVVWFQ